MIVLGPAVIIEIPMASAGATSLPHGRLRAAASVPPVT
jgi:hypothetical protein